MNKPWDMARVASRRELPKPRKMHGPVGEQVQVVETWIGDNVEPDVSCQSCGYHVCSCEPVKPDPRLAVADRVYLDDLRDVYGIEARGGPSLLKAATKLPPCPIVALTEMQRGATGFQPIEAEEILKVLSVGTTQFHAMAAQLLEKLNG